jgi:hypothetical protein
VVAITAAAATSIAATLLTATVSASISTATTRRALLEFGVRLLDGVEKRDTHVLRVLNLSRVRATIIYQLHVQDIPSTPRHLRNMQIHLLITLHLGVMLFETASSALDLNSAASLLLNVFHVRSASSHNLGAQVESRNRLEVDRDALFGPLAAA